MEKKPPKAFQYLLPSFGNILWIAIFFLVINIGWKMMNGDGDLGFHLTLGRYILDNRQIPLQDVFSHSMTGEPVMQHEWLTTVILATLKQFFGFEGIIIFSGLVIASAFLIVYWHARSKGNSLIALLVCLLTISASRLHWLTRPHIVTFLFLAVWIFMLDHLRQRNHHIWWLFPLLMLLWTNLHGAFIVGFITWFIYGIGIAWDVIWKRFPIDTNPSMHFWRNYILLGVTSWCMSLINPSGIGLWSKVISHVGNKYLADLTIEFQSPNFHWSSTWPFLILIALLIFILAFGKKKYRSEYIFNTIAWLMLSLYGARNIPLFAIITAPLLMQGLENLFKNTKKRFKILHKITIVFTRFHKVDRQLKGYFWPVLSFLFVILGFVLGFRFYPEGSEYTFDPDKFPVDAVNWLDENQIKGEMFNFYTWGGYLQYRLWPDKRVFIDGKADFYGEDLVRKYNKVMNIEDGWEKVLEEYDISWVILPAEKPAVSIIQCKLGWEKIYEDDTTIILQNN
jgi:hypothetical protein